MAIFDNLAVGSASPRTLRHPLFASNFIRQLQHPNNIKQHLSPVSVASRVEAFLRPYFRPRDEWQHDIEELLSLLR